MTVGYVTERHLTAVWKRDPRVMAVVLIDEAIYRAYIRKIKAQKEEIVAPKPAKRSVHPWRKYAGDDTDWEDVELIDEKSKVKNLKESCAIAIDTVAKKR